MARVKVKYTKVERATGRLHNANEFQSGDLVENPEGFQFLVVKCEGDVGEFGVDATVLAPHPNQYVALARGGDNPVPVVFAPCRKLRDVIKMGTLDVLPGL